MVDRLKYPALATMTGRRRITPGSHGAHNWQLQAYNPNTGLVYIPTVIARYVLLNGGLRLRLDKGAGVEIGLNVSFDEVLSQSCC